MIRHLLIAMALIITSCTSQYRDGQQMIDQWFLFQQVPETDEIVEIDLRLRCYLYPNIDAANKRYQSIHGRPIPGDGVLVGRKGHYEMWVPYRITEDGKRVTNTVLDGHEIGHVWQKEAGFVNPDKIE